MANATTMATMSDSQLMKSTAATCKPAKKSVSWENLASKREFDISSPPANSSDWIKRRVVIHDGHKPLSKLLEQDATEPKETQATPEARQAIPLPPPPPEAQSLADLMATNKEAIHTTYSCDSDSDSDSDSNSDLEEAMDSMMLSARPYRAYLGDKVLFKAKSPLCIASFIASQSPDSTSSSSSNHSTDSEEEKPQHKCLSTYVSEAKHEIGFTVQELERDIRYPKVSAKTRRVIRELEKMAEAAEE